MPTRSRTSPQEPVKAPPLAIASLVDAAWLCGNEWFTGVIRKEDVHPKVGHRWFIKFNDGDEAWLEDKYVRAHARPPSSSNPVASPRVISRPKKNAAARSRPVCDAGKAPAKKKAKKAAPVEKAAEIEEEEEVVEEKPQEKPMKKAESPEPEKVVLEKKPIVPFLMRGQGFVALPCQVMWALADSMVDEASFQSRRQGNQRSAQYEALRMQCAPTLGFSVTSPLCDILGRGHKLVRHEELTKVHYLNQLAPNGLDFMVESIMYRGWPLPFANVREATVNGTSQVSATHHASLF